MKIAGLRLEFHATPGTLSFLGVRVVELSEPPAPAPGVHAVPVASGAGATFEEAREKMLEHLRAQPDTAWLAGHVPAPTEGAEK